MLLTKKEEKKPQKKKDSIVFDESKKNNLEGNLKETGKAVYNRRNSVVRNLEN